MSDKDVMDKLDGFFEAFQKAGMEISEGQTAVVCKDGVVLITVEDNDVNVIFCNRKIHFDYELGITNADVKYFNDVMAMAEGE